MSKWRNLADLAPSAGPICPTCKTASRLTSGAEIYPRRSDLRDKPIWTCDGCGGRVGCHPGGTAPLGTPANEELRRARSMLHARLDPLWEDAWAHPSYRGERKNGPMPKKHRASIGRMARRRVYAFLADRMGLTSDQCHVGMFDLDQCRAAWRALEGVVYGDIRAWAKDRDAAPSDLKRSTGEAA